MDYHPWRELRHMPHVRLEWVDLPMGVHGRTNGLDRIEINSNLLQVERRCALAHELQHIKMGHRGHQPPAVELTVRVIVAQKLIPLDALLGAACWAGGNWGELAEELWVTPFVLEDRMRHLHAAEKKALKERSRGLVSV